MKLRPEMFAEFLVFVVIVAAAVYFPAILRLFAEFPRITH